MPWHSFADVFFVVGDEIVVDQIRKMVVEVSGVREPLRSLRKDCSTPASQPMLFSAFKSREPYEEYRSDSVGDLNPVP